MSTASFDLCVTFDVHVNCPAARQILDFFVLMWLLIWLCVFRHSHWEWGDRLSTPQVQRLRQRRPRVLRRKRDCTPPSSSHSRDGLLARLRELRRRKDWHFSLPPHTTGGYFGGRGTGPPPHNVREYLGGGRTGLPPHTVGVYFMSKVEDNDELNIFYSLTYRAATVEGDQHIVTSAVRQSYESFQ